MPIDPSIVLGIRPVQFPTMEERAVSEANAELARQKRQALIEDAQDNAAMQTALQTNVGPDGLPDFTGAIKSLSRNPRAQFKLQGFADDIRKKQYEDQKSQLEAETKEAAFVAQLAQGVTADNYETVAPLLPDKVRQALGPTFDPAKRDLLVAMGTQVPEYNKRAETALGHYLKGDYRKAIAEQLAAAPSPEAAAKLLPKVLEDARKNWNAPLDTLAEFQAVPPEQVQAFAQQAALTEAQRETFAGQAEGRAQTKTYQEAQLQQGQQRIGQAASAQAETRRHNVASEAIARQRANQAGLGGGTGGVGTTSDMPSEYQTALARVTLTTPGTRRGAIIATANRLWKEGRTEDLKDVIRQLAVEGENVDVKNQVLSRRSTVASLNDAKALLTEMKAAGVSTDILHGTAEDVARKLGTSTNPRYAEFATRLQATLINYRRAATGVQFSERENAEYQRMFPNYRQTFPVNEAVINGLQREMATQDRTYWENKLGKTGAELVGALPKDAQPAPTGSVKVGKYTVTPIK